MRIKDFLMEDIHPFLFLQWHRVLFLCWHFFVHLSGVKRVILRVLAVLPA